MTKTSNGFDRTDTLNHLNKIIETMQNNFQLKETNINISTSIGIAFYNNTSVTAEELIKQADDALYEAKNAGRNDYRIYS